MATNGNPYTQIVYILFSIIIQNTEYRMKSNESNDIILLLYCDIL
jgi:hypothetical protein